MKIHVLATDKPSRLVKSIYNDFILLNTNVPNWFETNLKTTKQNIYITNSEEIKEGDWCIDEKENIVKADKDFIFNCSHEFNEFWKKITLTTDVDLIKDGVQAIDDEFLEWFVKNPSCEYVEVETDIKWKSTVYDQPDIEDGYIYKIIIPKEETKQDWFCPKCDSYVSAESVTFTGVVIKEPKQETLEEVAKRLFSNMPYQISTSTAKNKALELVKWQQEQAKEMEKQQIIDATRNLKTMDITQTVKNKRNHHSVVVNEIPYFRNEDFKFNFEKNKWERDRLSWSIGDVKGEGPYVEPKGPLDGIGEYASEELEEMFKSVIIQESNQETPGYICPQTKKQCDDECCVSAEDCHIKAGIGTQFDCEQPKQETLEEVAKRYYEDEVSINAFINGYKLAQEQGKNMYSEEESRAEETAPHMKIKKLETRQPWLCEVDGTKYIRTEIKWTDDRPNDITWHLNEDQVEGKVYLTHEQLEKLFCESELLKKFKKK